MKKYTKEELCNMTQSELRLMRSKLLKQYQGLGSFISSSRAAIMPVVYMKRVSEDSSLYSVRTARSAMDLPGFKSHDDDDYGEDLAYATLKNTFMTNDELSKLAEKLKEAIAPYKKQLPDSDEYAYEMLFVKVRQWMDVVSAWDEQEQSNDPGRVYEFRRKVAAKLTRAQKEDDYDTSDDEQEPDVSQPINPAAAAAEKAKKQEMKKIAEFMKERVVRQGESAPPLPKDDILAMYRIWARGITLQSGTLIVEYMRTAFSARPVYVSDSEKVLAFQGFALKTDDWIYTTPNNRAANVFLREECVFSHDVRSFYRTIQDAYVYWHGKSTYPQRQTVPELKREVRSILDNCRIVFPAIIEVQQLSMGGWYGVALRNDPDAKVTSEKSKATLRNATIVERRMPGPNGALLESWPSMAKATAALNVGIFKLKGMIAQKIADKDGAILMYANSEVGTRSSGASTSSGGASTSAT